MALLWRIIVILFALWLATFAAGLVWTISLLQTLWQALTTQSGERMVFGIAAFLSSGVAAALLYLPMLAVVALTEAFKIRSLLIHALGGVVLTLLASQSIGFDIGEESIDAPPPPISKSAQAAVAAGAAYGLIYWLIAGRNAGRWRERRVPSA